MDVIKQTDWAAWLRDARAGDAFAQSYVGSIYAEGALGPDGAILVRRSRVTAKKWLLKSAEQSCPSGQLALSNLLSDIDSNDSDFPAAITWTKRALAQGDASAAHNLACVYRDMRKPSLAFRYFKRAVEMGSDDDLLDCALCYLTGYGVAQNFVLGAECLDRVRAANADRVTRATHENALYWSAVISLLGLTGSKRAVTKARQMLEQAHADDDHAQANELLHLIGRTPRPPQKKKPARQAGRAGGTS
jgi:TPR repeat protein